MAPEDLEIASFSGIPQEIPVMPRDTSNTDGGPDPSAEYKIKFLAFRFGLRFNSAFIPIWVIMRHPIFIVFHLAIMMLENIYYFIEH